MYAERYLEAIRGLIEDFAENEPQGILLATEAVAKALSNGARLHHFDTGHMREEPLRRAGGLFGLHKMELKVEAEHPLPPGREPMLTPLRQRYFYDREELAGLLLDKSHLRDGDVLLQVSNSGKEAFTVGVGAEAKKRGALLVVFTSLDFSKKLESKHSSGKKLYEIADHVIDLHAPFGDALLEIEGIDTPVGASSGVMTAVALWSFMSELTALLSSQGHPPAVYRSVNMPDGFAFNEKQQKLYEQRGF